MGKCRVSEGPATHLTISLADDRLGEFFPLLQQGITVVIEGSCTLEELLCRQWGIDPDYVKRRITTIFLNSRAVDDVKTAQVHDGAVVALSGAMPGLVGATMRRGGFYAAMRGAMTHHDDNYVAGKGQATVRVKLFNLLLPELGPLFLQRGILLDRQDAIEFFAHRGQALQTGCAAAVLDGRPSAPDNVGTALAAGNGMVALTVRFRGRQ